MASRPLRQVCDLLRYQTTEDAVLLGSYGEAGKNSTEDNTWALTDEAGCSQVTADTNYSHRRRIAGEQMKDAEQMLNTNPRCSASTGQSESPRNFNFTTDNPKGKFKEVLLWNQNRVHNKLVSR